jgi:hypothetical protein
MIKCMNSIKVVRQGDFSFTLMGVETPTHVLINNDKTNKESMMVPASALRNLLNGISIK